MPVTMVNRYVLPALVGRIRHVLESSVFLGLLALAGCMVDATEEFEAIDSVEQEALVCGTWCPAGQIPSFFACSSTCPGSCQNAVFCVPIPVTASISASPAIVAVPPGSLGTSKICWNTSGQDYPVWIKVSGNGAPEQLFTKESDPGSACEDAPWIAAGDSAVFRIRTQQTGGTILASASVVGVASAPPPPPPPPPPVCENCPAGYSCHCDDERCRRNDTYCP